MSRHSGRDIETRDYSREVIERISQSWSFDAEVMRFKGINSLAFDMHAPDFLEAMVPFSSFDAWRALEPKDKNDLLSAGWIIYQSNTIFIETDLVTPACIEVIRSRQDNSVGPEMARSMAEAMTDEGYHTLLAVLTCDEVRANRQLALFPADFHLVNVMNTYIHGLDSEWKRRIARIATACCTENHITDYLDLLANATSIQPMFLAAVNAHGKDEWSHGSQFAVLARDVYWQLSKDGKQVFKETVELVAKNFFRADLNAWITVIDQLARPSLDGVRAVVVDNAVELQRGVEFTNNNRGLMKLYDSLEWEWTNDDRQ
ncbi:diiron oxygenase [Pseudomonas sp. Marseille-Q1929]|uniref:diiron oxygenase n=1 Tax=Pseudomonas sp. Marseille-Q1929 TaxID=2730402 RepID=UPI001A8CA4DF|nr:diiron oxygenase [Pseudomonas sp. Marseille-Q1929]MBO0494666.1 diiron oxygenase [Pseudomonas sp. Marseille-Q1929]